MAILTLLFVSLCSIVEGLLITENFSEKSASTTSSNTKKGPLAELWNGGPDNPLLPSRNPYTTDVPFRVLDNLDPTAPGSEIGHEDDTEPTESSGTADKWYSFTKGFSSYVYVPQYMSGSSFPEEAEFNAGIDSKDSKTTEVVDPNSNIDTLTENAGVNPVTPIKTQHTIGAYLKCINTPTTWEDDQQNSCDYYELNAKCESEGKEKKNVDGVTAMAACCACGGGDRKVVLGMKPEKLGMTREIHSPMDKLPLQYYPLTNLAGSSAEAGTNGKREMVTAPADWISDKYRIYFQQLHDIEQHNTPHGLSTQFFSVATTPSNWKEGFNPGNENVAFTRIDPFIDFRTSGNRLDWPMMPTGYMGGATVEAMQSGGVNKKEPEIWWTKFSGTLETILHGEYVFDLLLGSDMTFSSLVLDGKPILTPGQCTVLTVKSDCEARGCIYQEAPKAAMLQMEGRNNMRGKNMDRKAQQRFVSLENNTRQSPPADVPAGICKLNEIPKVQLTEGGHCIEVYVRSKMRDVGRSVALKYLGPDSNMKLVTIPQPLLNCNPAVEGSGCSKPKLDTCGKN